MVVRRWGAMDEAQFQATRQRMANRPHPLEVRAKAYGTTRANLEGLYAYQDERCAICRLPFGGPEDFAVDHDHATGRVRGLLCGPCNSGLGFFRDSTRRLIAAARYLAPLDMERWEEAQRAIGRDIAWREFHSEYWWDTDWLRK